MRTLAAGLATVLALGACGPVPESSGTVTLPQAGATFDYQLGGAYPPPAGVAVVVRDSSADPPDDGYAICYVNAFQTQPGERGVDDLVLREEGAPVTDPAWPDEAVLDLTTADARRRVVARARTLVEACAGRGYDAVELDNLDVATRSRGAFTLAEATAVATDVVAHAHALGLAAARKNTPELGAGGRDDVGFDLAIAEQCDRWDECAAYTDVYDVVLDVEYAHDLRGTADDVCARAVDGPTTIVRDLDLVPAGGPGYVLVTC
ncbi:endo alpha-1,4 polygalactosaminidase [Actinotalea solisilvae]|uniref:endo alpha-1,4 polygalactosaminidase n=1 Tax=Actinotalea solisilvae TaxID=2072922 RepID=UPI0018F1EB66|nr:endo alpha-1,4 polygalactosaminidase [Actinotalea solisilvae]